MNANTTVEQAAKPRLTKRQRARAIRGAVYTLTLAVILAVALAVDWPVVGEALFQPELIVEQFPEIITQAARNTLIFTAFGFSGGFVLGLIIALMRLSHVRPYRWFSTAFIDVFRGLPAILTIILIGQGIPVATGFRLPGTYTAGSVAIAFVAAAYMAETIRAGIEAIPIGQTEAARSLGMTATQALRWIVIPQAFRIIIPPLTNEFVLLLKDTSLISVLGVTAATKELTRFGRDGVISSANATPLVTAGLVYLAMTIPLTRFAARLEKQAAKAKRI
jgi:polar amino acid transport system permease protein